MRRALRILAWMCGGLALLVLLGTTALLVASGTRGGRRLIASATARLSSGDVRISGLGGRFPDRIDIARLQLSDAAGPWLRARQLSLRWSPLALLKGMVRIDRLDVARVDVLRRPVRSRSSHTGFTRLLPGLAINQFHIATAQLAPATVGAVVRLSVHGSLFYRSITDARATVRARRTNGPGLYRLRLRSAPSALDAQVTIEEPDGGPMQQWLKLPRLGAVALTASIAGPPRAEQLQLRAHIGPLTARVHGSIDLGQRSANVIYQIDSPAMSPRPGLAWQHVAIVGWWHGPLATAQAHATLDLTGLQLADGAQLGALTASLSANGQTLSVHARAQHIRLPGPHPRLLRGAPLQVQALLQLHAPQRPLQLTVADRLFDLRARALTAGTRSATFALRVPDLSPFAALYHKTIRGGLRATGTIAQRADVTRLALAATARVRGTLTADRMLGRNTQLRLQARLTPTQLDIERLTLQGRAIALAANATAERSASGTAALGLKTLRARWRVSVPDLTRVTPAAAGAFELTGSAAGPMDSFSLTAHAHARLSLHGSPYGTIAGVLQARDLPAQAHALLRVSGTLAGAPLTVAASFKRSAPHAFDLDVERMTWKSLSVRGRLRANAHLATTRGRLLLSVDRLADLQPLVGRPLAGRLDGSLVVVPDAGRLGARIDLLAHPIEMHGLTGTVRLAASGPFDALRIRLDADSANIRGTPARLSVSARLDTRVHAFELVNFAAHYRGQDLHLLRPARLTWTGGLAVHDLRLAIRRTVFTLDGALTPRLDVRAAVEHLDAGLVNAFAPGLLSAGTLSVRAHLTGARTAPAGKVSVKISGLEFAGAAALGLPAVNLRGQATLRDGTANVAAALDVGRASRLTLRGRAPLSRAGSLDLGLTGTLDAALMNAMLEARGARATGLLAVNARVLGTTRSPEISGVVTLAGGDLRDYASGVHIGDINARLVGDHGVLRISSLSARAGPGHLSATGTIGLLQPRLPIHIALIAHRIQPITNDILTANFGADIHINGTLRNRVDVTGVIRVHHAAISIPNALPPNVATLHVIRPGEATPPVRPVHRLVVGLGLTLTAPQTIYVTGRGLDAQLGGKLEITGTSAHPRVSGGFAMTRGTFSLAGRNLDFTRGRVSFDGEGLRHRIDPSIDFLARSSVMSTVATTVTLRVTGFADNPQIKLSSNPPLPEDDLLALLLFGQPASQLSPYQLGETGAALASLEGFGGVGAGSLNPLTWIRRHLDLNTLSIGSGTPSGSANAAPGTRSSGASITAGKYVSNWVYVAATHTTQGTSQIRVDIALGRHLKLETRVGNGTATTQGTTPQNDPGSSIGLAYELRY